MTNRVHLIAPALLDPLLARPALVVEGDDPLGWARQIGDNEADARNKLGRMPLDFGDHSARLGPASCLIAEIGVETTHIIGWTADWPFEQISSDPPARWSFSADLWCI
jgi:hypothetical protein